MAMANIMINQAINMKVNGRITYQMEKEKYFIQMAPDITENFSIAAGMAKEF